MKRIILLITTLLCLGFLQLNAQTSGIPCADLFFSEYIEPASGHTGIKSIEIFNPSTANINLNGYLLKVFTNACAGNASTFTFPNKVLNANDVYVISIKTGAMSSSDSAYMNSVRDTTWGSLTFNGNDALMLISPTNDTLDIFGVPCANPTGSWHFGTDSTENITLVRNATIHNGSKNWANAKFEWTSFAPNTLTNLGSHSMVPCGAGSQPMLTFSPKAGNHNEAAGTVSIDVTLINPNPQPVVAVIALKGGNATNGTDFTYSITQVTFPISTAAFQTQNVTLSIVDDTTIESTETFQLVVDTVSGGAFVGTDSIYTGSIIDNDAPVIPVISFTTTSATCLENAGTFNLIVSITNPTSTATTVDINVTGGAATAGSDFTFNSPTTVTFPANSTANQTISVPVIDDALVEGAENIQFTLSNANNGAIIGSIGMFSQNITDNDVAPSNVVYFFNVTSDTILENAGNIYASIHVVNPPSTTESVHITAKGTATYNTDYGFVTSNPVNIPAGLSNYNVMINITDDASIEGDEIIELHLDNPSTGTIGFDSVMTILLKDNEGLGITATSIKEFAVYPNPVAHTGTIKLAQVPNEAVSFELVNLMGQKCVSIDLKHNSKANLNEYSINEGMYFFVLKNMNGQVLKTGKLIVK
jgi:hypothetical protein